jgi:hypothetical protein
MTPCHGATAPRPGVGPTPNGSFRRTSRAGNSSPELSLVGGQDGSEMRGQMGVK